MGRYRIPHTDKIEIVNAGKLIELHTNDYNFVLRDDMIGRVFVYRHIENGIVKLDYIDIHKYP